MTPGKVSLEVIQEWERTWAAVQRCMGSTWSIRRTRSLAEAEIKSQFPPDRGTFPSPILASICCGVSSGPVANGVQLQRKRKESSQPMTKGYHHSTLLKLQGRAR